MKANMKWALSVLSFSAGILCVSVVLTACDKQDHVKAQSQVQQQTKTQADDPNHLTRDKVSKILSANMAQQIIKTKNIKFDVETFEFQVPPDKMPEGLLAFHHREIEHGLVNVVEISRRKVPSQSEPEKQVWECRYGIVPTLEAKGSIDMEAGEVTLGGRIFQEVTGMTMPVNTSEGTEVNVEFTYKIALTLYGQIADPYGVNGLPMADERQLYEGKAQFLLYDDGWRIKHISLQL